MAVKPGDIVTWTTSTGTWTGTVRRVHSDGIVSVHCNGSIVLVSERRLEVVKVS